MELKERSLIKIFVMRFSSGILLMMILLGNKFILQRNTQEVSTVEKDTSMIPTITILSDDKDLQNVNGIYYYKCAPFSGFIKEEDNHLLKSFSSCLNGTQHGCTRTWYPNGQLCQERSYKGNKCDGKHSGWWENGERKFEFSYKNDKREGEFRQWYRSGQIYTDLHFKDDVEIGMQRAWRENGKLYLNYEVKDGVRYGLQKSALCYTLVDEKIKNKK
ncbi:MAG: hypothetical protein JWN78_2863 [Bacteroidota bacterium]|nr:hypothetical protein [Bacteroidota bacterium]